MSSCCKNNAETPTVQVPEGITKTLEYYADGSRKGTSEITRKAFTDNATMSWVENDSLQSIPIQGLYDFVDSNEPMEVSYQVTTCDVADDVAIVRIESQFGETKYADMFSMVKDGNDWKIVSKIYHVK